MEHSLMQDRGAAMFNKQLDDMKSGYYKLWKDLDNMRTKLRKHLSTVVAAFLGIIASLHQIGGNMCLEWSFFACIVLCVLSLVCLLVSSCEDLHNTKLLMKIVKNAFDEAVKTRKPIRENVFASPRLRRYSILFWVGTICFCLAILLFCALNMPIW